VFLQNAAHDGAKKAFGPKESRRTEANCEVQGIRARLIESGFIQRTIRSPKVLPRRQESRAHRRQENSNTTSGKPGSGYPAARDPRRYRPSDCITKPYTGVARAGARTSGSRSGKDRSTDIVRARARAGVRACARVAGTPGFECGHRSSRDRPDSYREHQVASSSSRQRLTTTGAVFPVDHPASRPRLREVEPALHATAHVGAASQFSDQL